VVEYCCMLGKNLVEFESIDEYNELKKIPSGKAIHYYRGDKFIKRPNQEQKIYLYFKTISNNLLVYFL
jgi:hypothetical protein